MKQKLTSAQKSKKWRKENPEKVKTYQLMRYQRDKESIIARTEKWRKNNPERWNELVTRARKKYVKSGKQNIVSKRYYYNHIEQMRCGNRTNGLIYGSRGCRMIKLPSNWFICKCGSLNKLEIHHEVYSNSILLIKKDIIEGRIYMLCEKCHKKWHKEHNLKTSQKQLEARK